METNQTKTYPDKTDEDRRAIAELANQIAVRYYEIPKEKRNKEYK